MPDLNIDEMKADADAAPKTRMTLEHIVMLGNDMLRLQGMIEGHQSAITLLQNEYNRISLERLPEAMGMLKLTDFGLNDGSRIEIENYLGVKISEENRTACHAWLRETENEDLIKNEIKATFGKGEEKYAKLLLEVINGMINHEDLKCGSLEQKEAVHPQTLKAFVDNWLKEGKEFPGELFKLSTGKIARLQSPKKKKGK